MSKKYLIILCSNVGDAICATPALRLLRQYEPDAQIDVLTNSEPSRQVVMHNPEINHIIPSNTVQDIKKLGAEYDDVLVFMGTEKEMNIANELGRPYHHGEVPNPVHLRGVGINLIQKLFPEKKLPAPEGNYLYPQASDFASLEEKLKKAGATLDDNEILIGCHVGCSKAAKRALQFWKRKISSHRTWPFENFYKLVQGMKKDYPHVKWVMTGTLGEQKIINKYFKKKDNLIDLTAQTSVLELGALMKYCRVFLSGDTGPMHVASCTDVSMVSLFSATHPDVTGPVPVRKNITLLRDPDSIANITVEQVRNALVALM